MFDWRIVLGLTLAFMVVYGISYVLYHMIWPEEKIDYECETDEASKPVCNNVGTVSPAYANTLLRRRNQRCARKTAIAKGTFDYTADRERRAKHEA